MQKDILWDKEIETILKSFSYDQIDSFLSSLDYAFSSDSSLFIEESQYDREELWGWLCSRDEVDLIDLKREIQKWLNKSAKIPLNDADNKLNCLGKNGPIKVMIAGDGNKEFHFQTIEGYLGILRSYLSMEKKSDFENDMRECFPNLFFVDDINSSINSLNRDFDESKSEIIEHLSALDSYKEDFLNLIEKNTSNRQICVEFTRKTGITCSPQAKRDGIKNLKVILLNDESNDYEEIVCELHTKFSKYNIDRTKQDRIYFSPGKSGVKEGKVIIKHIGTHL